MPGNDTSNAHGVSETRQLAPWYETVPTRYASFEF
jgi:hypothetical protein